MDIWKKYDLNCYHDVAVSFHNSTHLDRWEDRAGYCAWHQARGNTANVNLDKSTLMVLADDAIHSVLRSHGAKEVA